MKNLTTYISTGLIIILFSTCSEKEWDNPYDSDCPASQFTPYSLKANQTDNTTIELTWSNYESRIDGFYIERKNGNTSWSRVSQLINEESRSWSDTEFQPGTEYNYRIYASAGDNTSEYISTLITTLKSKPAVVIVSVEAVSESEIKCICKINDNGGGNIINRGVYWNTTDDSYGTKVSSSETSTTYSVTIKDLEYGVTYYISAFASNEEEEGNGNQTTIKITVNDITGETGVLTDIDGNIYNWVGIGRQAWMAENLKVTHSPNGADINYSYYGNSIENRYIYGALYNNAAAENACPTGWHLPSDSEWNELIRYTSDNGHNGTEGIALKSTSGWDNDGNGTDVYGFKALPGGINYDGDSFQKIGVSGYWWTYTFYEYYNFQDYSYYSYMLSDESEVNLNGTYNTNEFSVRCVRD